MCLFLRDENVQRILSIWTSSATCGTSRPTMTVSICERSYVGVHKVNDDKTDGLHNVCIFEQTTH